jgi:hypothetical protein
MVSKTFLIALLSVTGLIPIDLPAQDSGCTRRTIAVGVVDSAWNLVPGLSGVNFRGRIHGQEVKLLSATLDTNPRRIFVLLDASGSMMDPDGGWWKTERNISEYLIRFAPPRASIAFMGFTGTVLDTEGFAEDPQVLLKNLSALVKVCEQPQKARRTALYDAISSARDLLGARDAGDVVCPLTDGGDNKSRIDPKKVEEALLGAGVRLFGIVMSQELGGRGRTPAEPYGPAELHSMIEATGGNALFVPYGARSDPYKYMGAQTHADAVNLALQRLFRQMGEFYRVEVRLPEVVEKPTKWKLEVIDAGGKPMRGVEIHYPQELMPCPNVG